MGHPLFMGVEGFAFEQLISFFYSQEFQSGQVAIRKGDVGEWFAITDSGEFGAVLADADGNLDEAMTVATYTRGSAFGELALLYDAPRAATVVCNQPGRLWVLERSALTSLTHIADAVELVAPEHFMKTVSLLSRLTDAQRASLAATAAVLVFNPGQNVYAPGDSAEAFFCVVKGQAKVVTTEGAILGQFYRSSFFGLASLEGEKARTELAIAVGTLRVLRLPSKPFLKLIATNALPASLLREFSDAFILSVLSKLPFLQPLSEVEKRDLVESGAFVEARYAPGNIIIEQGQMGDEMFIIKAGQVKVSRVNESTGRRSEVAASMGSGSYFGEMVLLKAGEPRMATIVAVADVVCLKLSRGLFEELVGNMTELVAREAAKRKRLATGASDTASRAENEKLFAGLTNGPMLGKGAFGSVRVAIATDGAVYALKSMRKADVVAKKQVEHVNSERDILSFCDHPFLPYLIGTFQTDEEIFLLQELVLGGELFTVIQGRGINSKGARFYGACLVSALSYLHDQMMAHRDLKPENVLIDAKGYCKLIDFGFAKVLDDPPAYTFCGTPEYLAPEIVSGTGHGLAVDWWALGILLYEMLAKRSPFADEDPMQIYRNIARAEIEFSWFFDWDCADLIKALCKVDPVDRLGGAQGNLDSGKLLREHRFFTTIDFKQLNKREVAAPFVPNIKHATDTGNFDFDSDDDEDSDDESNDGDEVKVVGSGVGAQPFQKTGNDQGTGKYGADFADW